MRTLVISSVKHNTGKDFAQRQRLVRRLGGWVVGMREIEKVQVERAILHQVDAGGSGLRMSGRELSLEDSPRLVKFLAGHISNGLRDSQTRAAVWSGPTSNGVRANSQALLEDRLDLVAASQELASALHRAIGEDQRIARGALTVAVYHDAAADDRHPERSVAVMKLDPSGVFRPEWRIDDNGVSYLAVSELEDALPTLRERLQKCAFVGTARPENRYDLLVLDRQVPEVSAKFFMEDFLGAEVAFDDRALTEGLYRAMRTARNRLETTLPINRLMNLDDAIQGVFAGTAVDLDEWLPTLPNTERNAIDEEIRRQELDRAFDLDPSTRARLARRVRYRGDNGLEVQVDRAAYKDMVYLIEINNQNPRRFRVIIETSKWELG